MMYTEQYRSHSFKKESFIGTLSMRLFVSKMGLLLDLTPDRAMDDGENDDELEAELMNLVGSGGGGRSQPKKGDGKGEKKCTVLIIFII